jgi:hypothetical protein
MAAAANVIICNKAEQTNGKETNERSARLHRRFGI